MPKQHILRKSIQTYKDGKINVDVLAIRKFADQFSEEKKYELHEQQDVAEFFLHLYDSIDSVRNLVKHKLKYTFTCFSCNL